MKKVIARTNLLFWALILLPFALAAAALPFLPDPLPAHVGANGVVDRWGSRAEVFVLPAAGLCAMLLVRWILRRAVRDPKEARLVTGVLCGVGMLFLSITAGVTLSWLTFEKTIPAHRFLSPVAIGRGLCYIILSVYVPRVAYNAALGIRTRRTLADPDLWARVHRFGGKAMRVAGGILLLAGVLAFRSALPAVMLLITPIALAIACATCATWLDKVARK
jgi:uncharacterized membrane protein